MSKSKKSNKPAKIPQPIKIKKEKLEEDRALHSMAHFVDDRVELVKQIFGSLKTKTITNLAPEYLKENDMDEIQELCLNELLCLSKKRLLSIINATKCPSDTESSDDSDVEAKEEHISLEEISSGSELENGEKSKRKTNLQSRTKKNQKKPNLPDNKNGNDGQMSVLELLELQARARAIRSQLALEPVTKIEVDLDDDVSPTTKEDKSIRKRKKAIKETEKPLSSSSQQTTNISPAINETSIRDGDKLSTTVTGSQKIKLKRNFRKQNQEALDADIAEEKQLNIQKLKKEKSSRSPSPDVIPIEPEAETLCISDSASDTEGITPKKAKLQPPSMAENEDAEDGEIIDTEEFKKNEDIVTSLNLAEKSNFASESSVAVENEKGESTNENSVESNKVTVLECKILNTIGNKSTDDQEIDINNEKNLENIENRNKISELEQDIDGDQNDDVISIEGGDLETEMSEHLDEDSSSKCSISNTLNRDFNLKRSKDEKQKTNDVISIDSSDNEDKCTQADNIESWHARYLKSSKVSKVLAVSRLGKRVRDKLKTSKHSKREISDDNSKEEETDSFTSKHEEGSVEQYKEILELSHR